MPLYICYYLRSVFYVRFYVVKSVYHSCIDKVKYNRHKSTYKKLYRKFDIKWPKGSNNNLSITVCLAFWGYNYGELVFTIHFTPIYKKMFT